MSLQEVFLVNHSPSQAKERERMITAISGLTCSGPYIRSGPIGSLVRTLLASSRWYSPVRRLKWEVNPLYSERVSLYLKDDSNMLLKPFAVILNAKDIPSSRYLYRLVPSVHLTDGIEFGLLPTVTAQDYKRRGPGSRQQGLPEIIHGMLLPTPVATEIHHAERVRKWKSMNLSSPHAQIAGEKNPNGLTDFWTFTGYYRNRYRTILSWKHGREQSGRIDPTMAGRRTSDADTDSAGLERRTFTGEPEETGKDTTEEQPSGFLRPDWKEFPTQSPVCSRDDGLSTRLDGISFSR